MAVFGDWIVVTVGHEHPLQHHVDVRVVPLASTRTISLLYPHLHPRSCRHWRTRQRGVESVTMNGGDFVQAESGKDVENGVGEAVLMTMGEDLEKFVEEVVPLVVDVHLEKAVEKVVLIAIDENLEKAA